MICFPLLSELFSQQNRLWPVFKCLSTLKRVFPPSHKWTSSRKFGLIPPPLSKNLLEKLTPKFEENLPDGLKKEEEEKNYLILLIRIANSSWPPVSIIFWRKEFYKQKISLYLIIFWRFKNIMKPEQHSWRTDLESSNRWQGSWILRY